MGMFELMLFDMDERLIFNESLFAINQTTTLFSSQLAKVSRDFRHIKA